MKRFLLPCAMLVCLLTVASNTRSSTATVYDTFGPGDTFSGSAMAIGEEDNQVGFSFIPSQSGFLSDISVAVSKISGNGDMIFELYSDEMGIHGTVLRPKINAYILRIKYDY